MNTPVDNFTVETFVCYTIVAIFAFIMWVCLHSIFYVQCLSTLYYYIFAAERWFQIQLAATRSVLYGEAWQIIYLVATLYEESESALTVFSAGSLTPGCSSKPRRSKKGQLHSLWCFPAHNEPSEKRAGTLLQLAIVASRHRRTNRILEKLVRRSSCFVLPRTSHCQDPWTGDWWACWPLDRFGSKMSSSVPTLLGRNKTDSFLLSRTARTLNAFWAAELGWLTLGGAG